MSRPQTGLRDRLIEARESLSISQAELARKLRVTPEWMSRVINGHHPGSLDLELRLTDLLTRERAGTRTSAVQEDRSFDLPPTQPGDRRPVVASRYPTPQAPSTRADCESYFRHYLARAEASGNPNAFPAIRYKLERQFPLEEWENYESPNLEE